MNKIEKKNLKKNYDELCKEIEKLDDICDNLIEKFDKEWFDPERVRKVGQEVMMKSFGEYSEKRQACCQPHLAKLIELKREKRFTMPYELSELPDYGSVMSLKEFLENVECGGFINYDGFGRYVVDNQQTNIEIFPSDVENKLIRNEFETIIWYNR